MSDYEEPKPKKIKVHSGVIHTNAEADHDFPQDKQGKMDAKKAAHDGYGALTQSVADLNQAVKHVQGNLSYDFKSSLTEKERHTQTAVAGVWAAGSLLSTMLSAHPAGKIISGSLFVGTAVGVGSHAMVLAGGHKRAERVLRGDYLGKQEADLVLQLSKEQVVSLPVTEKNVQALVKAYEAATAYAKEVGAAHYGTGDLEAGIRKTMLATLSENATDLSITTYSEELPKGEKRTFNNDDIAMKTPVSGGTQVAGEPNSGLASKVPKPGNKRTV